MGGIVCEIPWRAIMRFDEVPTSNRDEREFDEQIRELYANPIIANAVATETQSGREVCTLLSKDRFSHADRVKLFEIAESLYEYGPAK